MRPPATEVGSFNSSALMGAGRRRRIARVNVEVGKAEVVRARVKVAVFRHDRRAVDRRTAVARATKPEPARALPPSEWMQ